MINLIFIKSNKNNKLDDNKEKLLDKDKYYELSNNCRNKLDKNIFRINVTIILFTFSILLNLYKFDNIHILHIYKLWFIIPNILSLISYVANIISDYYGQEMNYKLHKCDYIDNNFNLIRKEYDNKIDIYNIIYNLFFKLSFISIIILIYIIII